MCNKSCEEVSVLSAPRRLSLVLCCGNLQLIFEVHFFLGDWGMNLLLSRLLDPIIHYFYVRERERQTDKTASTLLHHLQNYAAVCGVRMWCQDLNPGPHISHVPHRVSCLLTRSLHLKSLTQDTCSLFFGGKCGCFCCDIWRDILYTDLISVYDFQKRFFRSVCLQLSQTSF